MMDDATDVDGTKAPPQRRKSDLKSKKKAVYTPRGARPARMHSKLATQAHHLVKAMLKGQDPLKMAAKFHKSISWYLYLTSGRHCPSLETLDSLARGLGFELSLTLRRKKVKP